VDTRSSSLFADGYSTSTLIGSVEIENTGTVDAKTTVQFWWLCGDSSKVQADDEVRMLAPSRSTLVFFRKDIGQEGADGFRSHPDYSNSKNCKAKATIDYA
jgi:hypothetical protein